MRAAFRIGRRCETLDPFELEERLLALGIRPRAGAPTARGATGPAAAAAGAGGDVDMFGVGTGGGPQLTRSGMARAMRNEPKRAGRLPTGDAGSEVLEGEEDPVEAIGPDEEVLRAGGKDAALDALFSGPSLDDDDDLYDVPEWLTRE